MQTLSPQGDMLWYPLCNTGKSIYCYNNSTFEVVQWPLFKAIELKKDKRKSIYPLLARPELMKLLGRGSLFDTLIQGFNH
ncbi:MAG TPA: hypothetical protein VK142_04820, partial [Bacillota bacterium]|nr:hypothetical protein [Bacillota bacterium]